jgi:hypothetical protein
MALHLGWGRLGTSLLAHLPQLAFRSGRTGTPYKFDVEVEFVNKGSGSTGRSAPLDFATDQGLAIRTIVCCVHSAGARGESGIQDGKEPAMAKYSQKAQNEVKRAVREYNAGELRSGPASKKVKSREQAIAIGISKARKKGLKVPRKASGK